MHRFCGRFGFFQITWYRLPPKFDTLLQTTLYHLDNLVPLGGTSVLASPKKQEVKTLICTAHLGGWKAVWLVDSLAGWLIGCLLQWLVGWLSVSLVVWLLAHWQACCLPCWLSSCLVRRLVCCSASWSCSRPAVCLAVFWLGWSRGWLAVLLVCCVGTWLASHLTG